MTTELIWPAPEAMIPVRARIHVSTVDEAAAFLAGAAVTTGTVVLRNWDSLAGDPAAPVLRDLLATFGAYVVRSAEGLTCTSRATSGHLAGISYDLSAAPSLAGIALVLAALADGPSRITGVSRTLETLPNLSALGGRVVARPDVIEIEPGPLRPGEWPAHGDPGLAVLGAVLGLVVPGIRITGIDPDAPGLRPFRQAWQQAMTADENILPGTTTGTVPYYG